MIKTTIGVNAGIVWKFLSEKGRLEIIELRELTNMRDSHLILALGWLARENKIIISEKDGSLYAEIINVAPNHYY